MSAAQLLASSSSAGGGSHCTLEMNRIGWDGLAALTYARLVLAAETQAATAVTAGEALAAKLAAQVQSLHDSSEAAWRRQKQANASAESRLQEQSSAAKLASTAFLELDTRVQQLSNQQRAQFAEQRVKAQEAETAAVRASEQAQDDGQMQHASLMAKKLAELAAQLSGAQAPEQEGCVGQHNEAVLAELHGLMRGWDHHASAIKLDKADRCDHSRHRV